MSMERRVALFLDRENVNERKFFEGFRRCATEKVDWLTYAEEYVPGLPTEGLRCWSGHGIAGFLREEALGRAIQTARIPAVNVSRDGLDLGIPTVIQDHESCGRTVADYFVRRGFRRFAYFARQGGLHRDLRLSGFRKRLEEEGFSCSRYTQPDPLPSGANWGRFRDDLQSWLYSLPKPVAVLARNDSLAARILAACEARGFRVPEEVSVVGWGNDEIVCPFTTPPLTSVESRWEDVGYEAALLLDRLMRGESAPGETDFLQPGRIVERQSSDALAVGDPVVAKAVGFIEEHACDPISVDDVVRHVSINRRRLERLFRRVLRRPPNTEIIRIRIQRVRQLLTQTDMPMSEIARQCGYPDHRCLGITFRRVMGITPSLFRRQARRRDGARLRPAL